ncbi:MAG: cupin domain-containing protein [Coxiellaceae bacterium]|nr:MAG: cupin domain-containing protein [Coxiellaceae bacterium]
MKFPEHFQFDAMPFEQLSDKIYRRYITGGNAMLVCLKLLKGAIVHKHDHVSEQITYIVEGKVRVTAAGKEYIVSKGEVLVLPPNVEHEFVALEDTIDIDVFAPVRIDWLMGQQDYLQKKDK